MEFGNSWCRNEINKSRIVQYGVCNCCGRDWCRCCSCLLTEDLVSVAIGKSNAQVHLISPFQTVFLIDLWNLLHVSSFSCGSSSWFDWNAIDLPHFVWTEMLPLLNSFMKRTSGSVSPTQPAPVSVNGSDSAKDVSESGEEEQQQVSSLSSQSISNSSNEISANANKSKEFHKATKRAGFLTVVLQALRLGNSHLIVAQPKKDWVDCQRPFSSLKSSVELTNSKEFDTQKNLPATKQLNQHPPRNISPVIKCNPRLTITASQSVYQKALQQFDKVLLNTKLLNASSSSLSSSFLESSWDL